MVDPQWASVIAAGSGLVAAGISAYVGLGQRAANAELRTEIANLRAEIAAGRAKDSADMKSWIDGRFMTADVVKGVIKDHARRIEAAEKKLEDLHEYAHTNVHDIRNNLHGLQKFGCDQREEHVRS